MLTNNLPATLASTLVMASALALAGCDDPTTSVEAGMVDWDISGLERLGDGYVYEGWVIVDGEPVSTGRFDVGDDGTPELDAFALTEAEVAGAEAFVLTIEPEMGDDPGPSGTKLMGGDFADGSADLSIAHGSSIGHDFTMASGSFILETPTTEAVADDYDLGVWFLDMAAGPGPSLDLPDLPTGWAYEGWVVGPDGPVSTGRFTALDMPDSDGAGPAAGPDGAPPFPGSDFVDPEMSVIGGAVVLSVEPEPDDSPAPFLLKPLAAMDVADAGAGTSIDLMNQAGATNPTGTARIQRDQ